MPPFPLHLHFRDLLSYRRGHQESMRIIPNTELMISVLYPPASQYIALRCLSISVMGHFEGDCEDPRDNFTYASWAQSISSVRATLKHLYSEQGLSHKRFSGEKI
jgi:hypothetical protein